MKQIAEIHQGLAEMEKDCSNGAWHPDYPDAALPIGDCETCNGRGTVPLLPKLRRECPCPGEIAMAEQSDALQEAVRLEACIRCWQSRKHQPHCFPCAGTDWVISPSDTDNLCDALEERYGKISISSFATTAEYKAVISTIGLHTGIGISKDRRLAHWLAAKNLVEDMRKKEGVRG